jgi:hypothetical protein
MRVVLVVLERRTVSHSRCQGAVSRKYCKAQERHCRQQPQKRWLQLLTSQLRGMQAEQQASRLWVMVTRLR